jgi:hypothetical protein
LELTMLAVLAAAVAGDAALIALVHRSGWPDVVLVVCVLGILACLALMDARVGRS